MSSSSSSVVENSIQDVWNGGSEGPLAGVRIVDFGQYVAGPLVAMMLADQGADVVRVDPPQGPRWDSPVNATLLRGRRNIRLDLHDEQDRQRSQALIASADIVIENFRPGVADRLGIGPATCLKFAPRLIYCSLPGFGTDDPRAGVAAWEGVVMAAAGAYSLRSPVTGAMETAFSPLPLASVFAALEAATATIAALIARDRDGVGQHVEVPLFDALFEANGAGSMSMERVSMSMVDFAPGWFRCADGRFINLISLWYRHTEAFIRAAGHSDWIDEGLVSFDRLKTDRTASPELRARLVELFKERPAGEWERLAHAHGLPLAISRSVTEWMAEPHALASGTLVDIHDSVLGNARVLGRAVNLSTSPDDVAASRRLPGSDDAALLPALDALVTQGLSKPIAKPVTAMISTSKPPLAGLRVVDFTRVMAGPTTGRILGQLGAEVIKVDSSKADQRAMVPLPIAHEYVNRGKRSIDLNLNDASDAQVMAALFKQTDIVVQNFTLGVAERLGIDEASARAGNPSLVYTYLNTYGRRGPWANVRGYAELANTATGITERTNGDREIPSGAHSLMFDFPRWPFTDYAGGVLGAFGAVLGVYERNKTGVSPAVETSLIRTTSLAQITYLIDYEGRDIHEPRGSLRGWSPEQHLYTTADGTVFIGARHEQVDVLLKVIGVSTFEKIEEALSHWSIAELTGTLQASDISVHRVEAPAELMKPDGVAAQRGLRIEDQTEAFGKVAMLGPIARLSRTPLVAGLFPQPFGAESDAIRDEVAYSLRNM